MYIYKITNTKNSKIYIGRTNKDIRKRFSEHISDSKYVKTTNPLHIDIREYGREKFVIEVVKEFYTDSYYIADTIELEYINKYNSWFPNGYNKRRVKR